jgi:hypothetical protein
MSYIETSVSATNIYSLSASYAFDDKIDLSPTLYQYDNGYSFFEQPIFQGTKDVKFANESFFAITSATTLESILNDTVYINPADLVIFTALKASNGKYITNVNNKLYATADTIGASEFFRITRKTDGTFTISQNNLYATVLTSNFDIVLQEQLSPDTNDIQKFNFYSANTQDTFTIRTQFKIPAWTSYFPTVERFLSYYDGDQSNVIKSIGMISNHNYVDENNYKFLATNDLNMFAIGFDGKIKWVKYYNELLDTFFNTTVDIKQTITDIKNNYLVEYPYKTKVTTGDNNIGNIKLNLLNLKNVMTPEYKYGIKKD